MISRPFQYDVKRTPHVTHGPCDRSKQRA